MFSKTRPSFKCHEQISAPLHLSLNRSTHFYKTVSRHLGGGGGLVTESCPTLMTPRTVASQAPVPMGFSGQEYWSGLQFPSPGFLFLSAELFSREAAPVCIPACSVWVSPPLGILARPGCGRCLVLAVLEELCAAVSLCFTLCSGTANDVEHLFMCLSALACFVMLRFESSLYTLDASPFSCLWFINSFSSHDDNSEACLWPDLIKNSLYREPRRSVCS